MRGFDTATEAAIDAINSGFTEFGLRLVGDEWEWFYPAYPK